MDKDTLEKLLGFTDFTADSVVVLPTQIQIHGHARFEQTVCPLCLEKCNTVNQRQTRIVRDMPVFGKEVFLHLTTRQFHCTNCQRFFYESFSFVESKRTMTIRLEKYLYQCCQDSAFKDVAARENVLWDVLQGLFTRWAKGQIKTDLATPPTRLGIDEFAYCKGKKDYAVVIVDLDRAVVYDVLENRNKEDLIAYFKAKGTAFCAAITLFSCDMWPGFVNTAIAVFPHADVVVDRFHLFAHLHHVLDIHRRNLRKHSPKSVCFKAIKWLLYRAWSKLSLAERSVLLAAFRQAPVLRKLYFLKNELRNIFEADVSLQEADTLITEWVVEAKSLADESLNTFVVLVESWKKHILIFFTSRATNGLVEGINNGIKTLKRVAYGFRNFEQFRLRIIVNFLQPL